MKIATLLFALFAFAPAACVSQQPGKNPAKPPLLIEAGEIQLTTLVDTCAAYLGCNILSSPQEFAGTPQPAVRLQKSVQLDRDGCEEFLASMLSRSGLALTWLDEKGSMLEVVNMNGPRGREVLARAQERSPEQVLARPDLKVAVTTAVPLEHINATIAVNSLRPFLASSSGPGAGQLSVGTVGSNKALLISGMQDQVAQAIRLVRKCDVPGSTEGMPPGIAGDDRIANLERRVKALEEQLGKARPAADTKK